MDVDLEVRRSLALFSSIPHSLHHTKILLRIPAHWPRTLNLFSAESLDKPGHPQPKMVSVLFAPSVQEMYPLGISQDVSLQKGAFIQVKGYDHQMEGKAWPTFFGGVATVVTKLFDIIEIRQLATNPSKKLSLVPPIADERLFWSKRYSTGSSSSPALRRFAFLPSRS